MIDWKRILRAVAVLVAALMVITYQYNRIKELQQECARHERNTETLMGDVETYRVRDSLNAAKVHGLELTLSEYKRFRADDAALIKDLQIKNRNLAAVNQTQAETIIRLSATGRDTVVIRDSIPVPALTFHCGDEWFDFDGLLVDRQMTGTLTNRDALMLVESIKYKRFLFWNTKRVKERTLNAVSKNPHTTIISMEHIVIEK